MSHERRGESNEWYTPAYIFDALGETFDIDVACPPEGPRHTPASRFYSEGALERDWTGFVWMNPPFGHQSTKRLWLSKFFKHGNGIALLPDRTSAPWWQEFAPRADAVLFIAPKVQFEIPEGAVQHVRELGKQQKSIDYIAKNSRFSAANVKLILNGCPPRNQPGTGTTLFAAGERASVALIRASSLGAVFRAEKGSPL